MMQDQDYLEYVAGVLGVAGSITTLLSLAALSLLIAYLLAGKWLGRKNDAVKQAIAEKDNEALARLLGGTSVPALEELSGRQKLTLATEDLRTRAWLRIVGYALIFFAFLALLGFVLVLALHEPSQKSGHGGSNGRTEMRNDTGAELPHSLADQRPNGKPESTGDRTPDEDRPNTLTEVMPPREDVPDGSGDAPLNITGRWIDQDGAEFRIQQLGVHITFQVFENGQEIGGGRGSIDNRIIHQTYRARGEQMECPADLMPGNRVIEGVCQPASGMRLFRLTRVSSEETSR